MSDAWLSARLRRLRNMARDAEASLAHPWCQEESPRLSINPAVRSKSLRRKSSFLDRRRQTQTVCFRRSSRSWRRQFDRSDASTPFMLVCEVLVHVRPATSGLVVRRLLVRDAVGHLTLTDHGRALPRALWPGLWRSAQ